MEREPAGAGHTADAEGLPVTFPWLERMSVQKLTFLEASGEGRPGPMPPIPPQPDQNPSLEATDWHLHQLTGTYFFIRGHLQTTGESRQVRGPLALRAVHREPHPHLLLGPGEEDALDIVCPSKVGRHGVGAQIPQLLSRSTGASLTSPRAQAPLPAWPSQPGTMTPPGPR